MPKYFIRPDGVVDSQCFAEIPANPDNWDIVTTDAITGNPTGWTYLNGVFSPPVKSAEQLLAEQKSVAKQYLANTDWYFARKQETGQDVPEEILTKRAEARALLQ